MAWVSALRGRCKAGCTSQDRELTSSSVSCVQIDGLEPFHETWLTSYLCADEEFEMRQTFELVFELRPSSQSGLLLHVGDSDHHLTVFMRKGEVGTFFKFARSINQSINQPKLRQSLTPNTLID